MGTPNPEHVRRLITVINSAPFFQLLSMKIQNIGVGYCVTEIDLGAALLGRPLSGVFGVWYRGPFGEVSLI
jgi:hypothetical protein